jgi:hypothetical protein
MPDMTANAAAHRRGGYVYRTYASVLPYDEVLRGAVSATPTFPALTVAYTVVSGSHSNVKTDQLVVFYDSTGKRKGSLRVAHGTVTNVSLPIEEVAAGTVNILSGDSFRVFDAYELRTKLVSATAALLKDSRITYSDQNSNQPPVANCGGLWAGFADPGQVYATVTFDASVSFTVDPDSAGTKTYLWAVGDGSITVGSTTTASITVQFPVGFRHITLTVTDSSNSKSTVRRVPVWVHNTTTYAPLSIVLTSPLSSNVESGWSAAFELPVGSESSLDNLPDGALITVWEKEFWNGTEVSYGSNTANRSHIKASLYLIRDTIHVDPDKNTVTFEAVSPLSILEKTPALPQLLVNKASPAKWSEYRGLTLNKVVDYLIRWHSSALTYFDFQWVSGTDLSYNRISVDGDTLAAQLRDIANSINVSVTCDHLGAIRLIRDPDYESLAARASRTIAYDLTTADMMTVDLTREHRGVTKSVRGEAITSANKAVFSNAPGNAPSWMGTGNETLSKQIVASQAEINTRSGLHFAKVNSLYNGEFVPRGVRITLPDSYAVFELAYLEYITLTLPANVNTRGIEFTDDTRWTIQNIEIGYDAERGSKDITITIDHETYGADGVTYVPPPEVTNGVPTSPPIEVQFPDLPVDPYIDVNGNPIIPPGTTSGNECEVWSADAAWLVENVLNLTEPPFGENTPDSGYTITDFQWIHLGSPGAYLLMNDGADSVFVYWPDLLTDPETFVTTDITGVYQKIRPTSTAGEVYIKSDGAGWEYTFDFTDNDGLFDPQKLPDVPDPGLDSYFGVWNSGLGWGEAGVTDYEHVCYIGRTVTDTIFTYAKANASGAPGLAFQVRFYLDGVLVASQLNGNVDEVEWSGEVTADLVMVVLQSHATPPGVLAEYITTLELHGLGVNPFDGSGGAGTRFSDDYGAIFASFAACTGSNLSIDTQKIGTIALAGGAGQVMKATSGGAWAAYGDPMPDDVQPIAIWIPRYKSSGVANSGANPDYIVATDTLATGNESVWYVSASGTVFTDISPAAIGGDYGLAVSPDCITNAFKSGLRYAALLSFDGVVKLHTSVNAGSSWTNRSTVLDANYVRYMRGDATLQKLYISSGAGAIIISQNHGAALATRLAPDDAELIGVEPFG